MGNWLVVGIVAAVCLLSAFLILYQQSFSYGVWFEARDIHHETVALVFIALGIGVLLGAGIIRSNGNN